ncbi:MAG: FCD domain-containing protein [Anaerolineales bacterium]|nr:FCD domain-containing protein [Anaerolineales bacterium]
MPHARLLESYAVTVGLSAMTDETLPYLRQLITNMRSCVLPRDLPRLIQLDLEFHRHIAELAGSATLLEGWSNLSGRIGALIMRSMEENQLRIEDAVQLHADVVDALATRDPRIGRLAIITHYVGGHIDDPYHIEAVDLATQAVDLRTIEHA